VRSVNWWRQTGWHLARAAEIKTHLINALGDRCDLCGSGEALEIDHVDGRKWRLSSVSSHRRWKRSLEEFENGVRLRLLCRSCNASYRPPTYEEAPF
jgi:hypothetical protein